MQEAAGLLEVFGCVAAFAAADAAAKAANVTIQPFSILPLLSNGNKGIACGLNNLQKLRDGEPLGGKSRAEDDFASDEEDDFLE